MTRDPLAGVQTALEECHNYLINRAPWTQEVAELLTEVEVGLTLLREVRNQRKAA